MIINLVSFSGAGLMDFMQLFTFFLFQITLYLLKIMCTTPSITRRSEANEKEANLFAVFQWGEEGGWAWILITCQEI